MPESEAPSMAAERAESPWPQTGGLFREPRLERLGLPHGFTHRRLGDMKGAGQRAQAVRAAGGDPARLVVNRQVHGVQVLEAGRSSAVGAGPDLEGDGLVTAEPGLVLGVFAADCLPLLLWDDGLGAVGAFHAGWRGLAEGMGGAAVRAFRRFGVYPAQLRAAVGPHIGLCCYAVGGEVARRMRPASVREDASGLRLDLGAEALAQLVEAGLAPERVSISADCTACRPADFVSYRRDGRPGARVPSHLAFIALPSRAVGS